MSGTPPQLPPAALAGHHQSSTRIDRVAVRLIQYPDGLRSSGNGSLRIIGTVTGSSPDGRLDVKTDKGQITLGLRDAGQMPIGTRLDIEIPAGHSPQKATIAVQKQASTPPPQPEFSESAARRNADNALQINQNLSTQSLGVVLGKDVQAGGQSQLYASVESPYTLGQLVRATNSALTINIAETTPADALVPDFLEYMAALLKATPAALEAKALAGLLGEFLANTPKAYLPQNLINNIKLSMQSIGLIDKNMDLILGGTGNSSTGLPLPSPPHFGKPLILQMLGFFGTTAPHLHDGANLPTTTLANGILPLLPMTSGSGMPSSSTPPPLYIGHYQGPIGPQGQGVLTLYVPQNALSPAQSPLTAPQEATMPLVSVPLTLGITPTNMPVGTLVLARVAHDTGDGVMMPVGPRAPLGLGVSAWFGGAAGTPTWDSLDGILAVLTATAPAQAGHFTNLFPSPMTPQNIGPLSLFFLSMLRTGDTENWMGPDILALLRQTTRGQDLLRTFSRESQFLRQVESQSLPQDWRATTLPFLFGHHIQKLPVYYKRSDDESAAKDNKQRARRLRFLFDLQMTRMGAVQIDGFLQSQAEKEENRRLDIILRTKHPLSTAMQSQMKRLYAGATEKSRLTGDLSFQFKPEQWVTLDLGSQSFEDTVIA